MDKRSLQYLVGQVVDHKKLGPCEVLEVISEEEGKILCKVAGTGETKRLIFSSQFFDNVDDFVTVNVSVQKKAAAQKVHKKVDLDKYRNHPLVKKIDQQEGGYRARTLYDDDETLITPEAAETEEEEILI